MAKTCIKCGHERRESDTGPDYACPACGVVYAKAEAAHAQAQAARHRAEAIAAARARAQATLAVTQAPATAPVAPPAAPADALMQQLMAQAGPPRAPSPYRGMALAVLIAFSVGFASAAGMYSAASRLQKPPAAPGVCDPVPGAAAAERR